MKTEQFFTEEIDKKKKIFLQKKKQPSVNAPEAPTAYPAVACAGVENNDFDSDDFFIDDFNEINDLDSDDLKLLIIITWAGVETTGTA